MAEDAVTKYLDAQNRYKKTQAEIQEMQAHIKKVSDALVNYYAFRISGIEMSAEAGFGRGTYSFEPKKWPDAERITNAILDLHKTHKEATEAWSAVPQNYRNNLEPPRP